MVNAKSWLPGCWSGSQTEVIMFSPVLNLYPMQITGTSLKRINPRNVKAVFDWRPVHRKMTGYSYFGLTGLKFCQKINIETNSKNDSSIQRNRGLVWLVSKHFKHSWGWPRCRLSAPVYCHRWQKETAMHRSPPLTVYPLTSVLIDWVVGHVLKINWCPSGAGNNILDVHDIHDGLLLTDPVWEPRYWMEHWHWRVWLSSIIHARVN